jgi:hypothetical protein
MRQINFKRCPPSAAPTEESKDLLDFIENEARVWYHIQAHRALPALPKLNEILMRGNGDDGFILMKWEPFALNDTEYQELKESFERRRGPAG